MLVENQERLIEFSLIIVVEPDGDEFHAYCPALKGLHTSGQTVEEALQNARDAATAYLRSLMKHRDPIPVGCVAREQRASGIAGHHDVREYVENLSLAPA